MLHMWINLSQHSIDKNKTITNELIVKIQIDNENAIPT